MKIQDQILSRKIGVFELLAGAFPFELLFGSSPRAILLLLLGIGFYFAKKKFQGEFSLLQIAGLFSETPASPATKTTENKTP